MTREVHLLFEERDVGYAAAAARLFVTKTRILLSELVLSCFSAKLVGLGFRVQESPM